MAELVGMDKQADGGTHVASTAEVGRLESSKQSPREKATSAYGSSCMTLEQTVGGSHLASLYELLRRLRRVTVAFSGGADSAFLAYVATDALGPENAHCVTAVSPSLATAELNDCAQLAREWSLNWSTVETAEFDNEQYVANAGDRCYWCKAGLMDALLPIDAAATVILGVNTDDLGDHRPGQQAAADRGAVFPMVEAGLSKDDIRRLSRHLGLQTWNKPAAACLSSRIPYGTSVTVEILTSVGRAEAGLKALGFADVRVRHYGETARIEVPPASMANLLEKREKVVEAVGAAGYEYVTLDLQGLRSGNLNSALREPPSKNSPPAPPLGNT